MSSRNIAANPIVIDLNSNQNNKEIKINSSNPQDFIVEWARSPLFLSGNTYKQKDSKNVNLIVSECVLIPYEDTSSIKNAELVLTDNSLKLKDLFRLGIFLNVEDSVEDIRSEHELKLQWKFSDTNVPTLQHPFSLYLLPNLIKNLRGALVGDEYALKVTVQILKKENTKNPEFREVIIPLKVIKVKANPTLATKLEDDIYYNGLKWKVDEKIELGVLTLNNKPSKAEVSFAEAFEGKIIVTTEKYHDVVTINHQDNFKSLVDKVVVDAYQKKQFALYVDCSKLPAFEVEKEIKYTVKAISERNTVIEEKVFKVNPSASLPIEVAPPIQETLLFGNELKEWKEIKEGVIYNNIWKIDRWIKDVQITLESHDASNDLALSNRGTFIQIELEKNGYKNNNIRSHEMGQESIPYQIWMQTKQLNEYQGTKDKINFQFLLQYRIGEDTVLRKTRFEVEFAMKRAEAKFEMSYKPQVERLDLRTINNDARVLLGVLTLSNLTDSLFANTYQSNLLIKADEIIKKALGFDNNKQEIDFKLPPKATEYIQLFVNPAPAYLPYSKQQEITFKITDQNTAQTLPLTLTIMPTKKENTASKIAINSPLVDEIQHNFKEGASKVLIFEFTLDLSNPESKKYERISLDYFPKKEVGLVTKRSEPLFELELDNQFNDEHDSIPLERGKLKSVKLYYNPKAVEDYTGSADVIRFTVGVICLESQDLKAKEYEITQYIRFEKKEAQLGLNIQLDNPLSSNVGEAVQIGYLELENTAGIQYAHSLNGTFKVWVKTPKDEILQEVITLDKEASGKFSYDETSKTYKFKGLEAKQPPLKIPIIANLKKIGNLDSDTTFSLIVEDANTLKQYEGTFVVGKYIPKTDAIIQIRAVTVFKEGKLVKNEHFKNETYLLPETIDWTGDDNDLPIFEIAIENEAKHGNGRIEVTALSIEFEEQKLKSGIIELEGDNKWLDILQIEYEEETNENRRSSLRDFDYKDCPQIVIQDGATPYYLYVSLKQRIIEDIKAKTTLPFFVTVKCKVYLEENDNPKEYEVKCPLEVPIRKDLGPDWLAIDFGTSAIVAAFGDLNAATSEDLKIIPLLEAFVELKQKNIQQYSDEEQIVWNNEMKELTQEGSHLLPSSMIILRDGKLDFDETDYEDCFIDIAPSKKDLAVLSGRKGLPYLKSLIGISSLLNVNPKLGELSYGIKKQNAAGEVEIVTKKITKNAPQIMDVVRMTYQTLIRHFILSSKELENKALNKLVLTIPNSFTPLHIEELRKAALASRAGIEPENIAFVTESDAIAYYYFLRKGILASKRTEAGKATIKARGEKEGAKEIEYVLVYDIGAGTIDLTYFSIKTEKDNPENEITILGKMSKNSAGNYLDYVIIEGLQAYFGNQIITEDVLDTPFQDKLKEYVRDILKKKIAPFNPQDRKGADKIPLLDTKKEFFKGLGFDEAKNEASPTMLFDKLMPVFEENTTGLFQKFFDLFGGTDNPLDTVIITGRSSQFVALQEKIESSLKKISGNQHLFVIKHCSSEEREQSYGDIELKVLKTIVALGALSYATQFRNKETTIVKVKEERLQARYGLLYGNKANTNIDWKYLPLFEPDTPPKQRKENQTTGSIQRSYQAESPVFDIRGISHFMLVLTYEGAPEKAYYQLNGTTETYNTNYITTMIEFTNENLTDRNATRAKVRLEIDGNNQVIFRMFNERGAPIFRQQDTTPLKSDLTKSDSFLKGMWPYIQKSKD